VTATTLDVRPVHPDDWGGLADFFGPNGAYANCWCTWWRRTAAQFDVGCRNGGAGNREVLERLTVEGAVPGMVAYAEDGGPVGWVSVAPRPQFGRVLRSPALRPRPTDNGDDPPPDDGGVWAVVCFWVPRGHRRHGVGAGLLDAAVDWARSSGAQLLEGYPVDPGAEGRAPSADLFTGTVGMFLRAGFEEVREPATGARRHVVRLTL
jgi:GNAT superfamily N-acetyltransferase